MSVISLIPLLVRRQVNPDLSDLIMLMDGMREAGITVDTLSRVMELTGRLGEDKVRKLLPLLERVAELNV